MTRLIIADDQLLFRAMLEEILKKDPEIDLIASCSNGEDAVSSTIRLKPDVTILDIQMPLKSGLEALREIKKAVPETKVIMLTTFESEDNIKAACDLGADGYLLKELRPDVLLMAVKCVCHDIVLFHRSVYSVQSLNAHRQAKGSEQRFEFGGLAFDFVDISIMRQIALGKTNRDIASSLNYSEGTIKNKVSRILASTGLSDRTEISVFAIKNQII